MEAGQLVVPKKPGLGLDVRPGRDQALPGQLTMEESVSASKPIPEIYRRLGVRPVIHGSGTTTRYGGSRLRPEVFETMREASQTLVNIDELNAAAGAAIARMLGAEAAFVSAGASSGLILQAAACIAGDDPAKITRLPDSRGHAQRDRHPARPPLRLRPGLSRRRRCPRGDRPGPAHAAVRARGRDHRPDGRGRLPGLAVHEPAGHSLPRPGRGDRPPPRRAGHRGRRVHAAAARQPDQVPPPAAPTSSASAAARASAVPRAPASWPDAAISSRP